MEVFKLKLDGRQGVIPFRHSVRTSRLRQDFGLEVATAFETVVDSNVPTTMSESIMSPSNKITSNSIGTEQARSSMPQDFQAADQSPPLIELELAASSIVVFTGESGSGKSTLLAKCEIALSELGQKVLTLQKSATGDGSAIIDCLQVDEHESLEIFAACGLAEPKILLSSVAELSEGQRHRFQIAEAIAQKPDWIVIDEFTSSLDRPLARVIAANLCKLASQRQLGFLLATTHQDILSDLQPDLQVECKLGGDVHLSRFSREGNPAQKKILYSMNAGSVVEPNPIGRTSLGGITAVIRSV